MTLKSTGLLTAILLSQSFTLSAQETTTASTQLLWGDTHLHTSLSFDAYLNQNDSADPDTAYRWAKGQPVLHPYTEARVQIATPLDFLVVSDHAEAMGVLPAIHKETVELGELSFIGEIKRWIALYVIRDALDNGTGAEVFSDLLPAGIKNWGEDPVTQEDLNTDRDLLGDYTATKTSAWQTIIAAAEQHNEPGKFTALLGWEWSSIPSGANLHRVVITPNGGDKAKQYLPFGFDDKPYPQDLWAWLDATSKRTGSEFLAIPHNANLSKGYMFDDKTLRGEPIDKAYAETRMRWEPIVEVTQLKGDSETHPDLSPDDEFADYETYPYYLQRNIVKYRAAPGDYMRSALLRGLQLAQKSETNPYAFGVIGSTDAHTGLSSAEEDNFWGKMAKDSIPKNKWREGNKLSGASGWDMGAAGMAAVWAQENTRHAIFDAMQRKETYATTGPRIKLRFFAGWQFNQDSANEADIATIGYEQGVPMGGALTGAPDASAAPRFLIDAQKDPRSANLDRVQVIKGWVDNEGQPQEKIYNAAWSDQRVIDASGKLPAVGNTIDMKTGRHTDSIGAASFRVVWADPDFDASRSAFYYVRVLQIPTARHSLLDALALGDALPESIEAIIQERAYSSPVWYNPSK